MAIVSEADTSRLIAALGRGLGRLPTEAEYAVAYRQLADWVIARACLDLLQRGEIVLTVDLQADDVLLWSRPVRDAMLAHD